MSITSFLKSQAGIITALSLAVAFLIFACQVWSFWPWFSTNSEALRKAALIIFALVIAPLAVWRTLIANKNTDIAYKNT